MRKRSRLITIRYSRDAGEAELNFSDEFHAQSALFKLDIVNDLLSQLEDMYEDYLKQAHLDKAKRIIYNEKERP